MDIVIQTNYLAHFLLTNLLQVKNQVVGWSLSSRQITGFLTFSWVCNLLYKTHLVITKVVHGGGNKSFILLI